MAARSPVADGADGSDGRERSAVVLSGGVGAARLLAALVDAAAHGLVGHSITAVVNTADDCVMHGLSISPDLDTVVYTLADAIDPGRGWGLVDETWHAMRALERYEAVRPTGSAAAPRWFNLGDRDLATHFYRTARLAEGATLTAVTDEVRRAWAVPVRVLPMSDDPISTVLGVEVDGRTTEVAFQEYFVRLRHGVPVRSVRFAGSASLSVDARTAIDAADVVVIAPSNPIVSIGPLRSLPGVDDLLAARRDRVVAVSPIVGGAAIKGPADRMLVELGYEASVAGVAHLYAPIASVLIVDPADAHLAGAVEAAGMRCVVIPSVMSSPPVARALAAATIAAVG
jgi:LPPG:FO 2-phospho-L-lactate transferase